MSTSVETKGFQKLFERFEKDTDLEMAWLHSTRKAALARFSELGFPKTHMEDWRFTNVAPLVGTTFGLAEPHPVDDVKEALLDFTLGEWKRSRLIFINGRYSEPLSTLQSLPKGAVVKSLAAAMKEDRELVESHLAKVGTDLDNAFAALNLAFVADGAFIHLPDQCIVDDPIHLLYFSTSNGAPTVSHPRNLIVAGKGSQAKIVESYVGREGQTYFTNTITEVVAGDGAVIDHYKLQRESTSAFHTATIKFEQGRGATVSNHSISLGGGLVRNDIHSVMQGEGGDCTLNGIYVARGRQHVDHHTVIDHAEPHCSSRELYKGILDDKSRAVFNGRIVVRPDAQKTDSQQSNRNLLLSDDALVNTNPQLEIYADDVKCAHGATIGQLDADALFYLRSRGIDEETARTLLIHGFLADMGNSIKIEAVRSGVECILMTSLPQGH
jgi:Fe-S cluster assembly protein SufD